MLSKLIAVGVAVFGTMTMMSTAQADPQRGYGGRNDRVECVSDNYRYTRCGVDWDDAELVRQTSESRCIEDRTWGVDRGGLWVDRGCGGIFVERGRGGHHGGGRGDWRPGPDWDRDIRLTCESRDYRYNFCEVDTGRGGGVRIDRQISQTACIQGRSWGYNRAGIWVSGGCAAVFRIDRRWR
jgi:hypothetical protein